MEEVLILSSVIAAVVLGLVELVKSMEVIPKKYLPVVGLFIGVIAGLAAYPFTDLDIAMRLWAGIIAGLTATGFFEMGKNIKK